MATLSFISNVLYADVSNLKSKRLAVEQEITSSQIVAIERRLDSWLKVRITRDNIYKATYQILDAVPSDISKTWDGGYDESAGWRSKNGAGAEIAKRIAAISDNDAKKRLWGKLVLIVEKMYKITKSTFVLSHCGHIDPILNRAEQRIKKLRPEDPTYFYIAEVDLAVSSYLSHLDKVELLNNPKKVKDRIEKIISDTVEYISDRDDLPKHYYELTDWVEVYLLHRKTIPSGLNPIAIYMVERDEQKMKDLEKSFQENTRNLRKHIQIIKSLQNQH